MTSIQDKINELLSISSPQKSFLQQKGGQRNRTLKCLKDILKFLSGNEVGELLNIYLLSKDGKQFINQIDLYYKNKSIDIIKNIKNYHENIPRNNKYKVLSLLSNNYTKK